MEELPIAVQMKLRELPGAESGVQRVDLILEDGRIVPEVAVVRLPRRFGAPPSPQRAFLLLAFVLLGILALFWLLWAITPESVR
jgi:hypothetical protein